MFKEILLALIKKLNSWQAYTVVILILVGYFGLQFYEKQTERLVAIASKPKAEKTNWVDNQPMEAGIGIERNTNKQLANSTKQKE